MGGDVNGAERIDVDQRDGAVADDPDCGLVRATGALSGDQMSNRDIVARFDPDVGTRSQVESVDSTACIDMDGVIRDRIIHRDQAASREVDIAIGQDVAVRVGIVASDQEDVIPGV